MNLTILTSTPILITMIHGGPIHIGDGRVGGSIIMVIIIGDDVEIMIKCPFFVRIE